MAAVRKFNANNRKNAIWQLDFDTRFERMDLASALRRTEQQWRTRRAIVDGTLVMDWAEFAGRTQRLAAALDKLGLRHGQPVAILSYSSFRVLECFYAVPWAGGAVCPLNFRLSVFELLEIINDARIEIIIADEAFSATALCLMHQAPNLKHFIYAGTGPAPNGALAYESLIADEAPMEEPQCREEDVCCLYYTGGTTGKAKGVLLTHANVFANTMNFAVATAVTEDDVILHCGPLFHVAAGSRIYNAGVFGVQNIIMPRFDARAVLQHIAQHRVTICSLVPTMLNTIVQLEDFDLFDLSSLRMILYGAAQITRPLLETVIRKFSGVQLLQAYGQTETAPFATVLAPRYHTLAGPDSEKLGSAGRPAANVEIRVADAQDRSLPVGVVGEILVRGPNVMKGYLHQPELTAQALRGGWMHTGDLGYLDDDGFLFVVDRIKDMIISGGENIYSTEVENAIAAHPGVAECAVFGLADETWGEIVHAVIVPRAGHSIAAEDIKIHCRRLIGGFKIPRSIGIRAEPLPLSGANKVLKNLLRAEFLSHRQD